MKIALLVAAAVTLVGCVSASATMLDERTAIVSSLGAMHNTRAEVVSAMMKQAAATTEEKGFDYFQIVDSQDTSRSTAFISPASAYGPGYVSQAVAPAQEVMIRMFRAGEIDPAAPGIWSATSVLAANK